MNMITLSKISDAELVAETRRVAGVERTCTADLIGLLIEVERRDLHLSLGYSSLFAFCTQALRLSEQAAYSRITAARAARRFPAILTRLSSGALTLSGIGLLAPHLTVENDEAVLAAAEGKSTREIERLIASLHPQPDIPSSVRRLSTTQPGLTDVSLVLPTVPSDNMVEAPKSARPVIAPLAPARYLLKITISDETQTTLRRLQALLRHSVPDGDPATIIDRALTLLLAETESTKAGRTSRPRTTDLSSTNTRHVPAALKRAVWARDGGRCAFQGSAGRCSETAFLEFHHVVPFAAGGATAADNMQLRCRAHNAYEARLYFGEDRALSASP